MEGRGEVEKEWRGERGSGEGMEGREEGERGSGEGMEGREEGGGERKKKSRYSKKPFNIVVSKFPVHCYTV